MHLKNATNGMKEKKIDKVDFVGFVCNKLITRSNKFFTFSPMGTATQQSKRLLGITQ